MEQIPRPPEMEGSMGKKKIPTGFVYFASLDHVLMGRVGTFEIFFFWGNLKLCLTPENDVNPVLLTNAL